MPLHRLHIKNPQTIGELIRNKRLELGMYQKDLAKQFGVTPDTVVSWELNRNEPDLQFNPRIFKFLECIPFEMKHETLEERIKSYRILHGLSFKKLAKQIGIDETTLTQIESCKRKPSSKTKKKIVDFLDSGFI